jgi:hypothetical protein
MPPAAFQFPPPPPFDFTRRPLALGPDDLLPQGELPDHGYVSQVPEALRPRVRFAREDRAQTVSDALSRCALEPDKRVPLPPGLVDVFTLPGRYRLLSLKPVSADTLVTWLGGEAHDSAARDDEEIVLSFCHKLAAVFRRADLIADPSPLLINGAWPEVVEAYPQDGRWLIESTWHQEIRLYLRNPSPSET